MQEIIIILLIIALITSIVLSNIERKDLYSRIMARDLTDYKTNGSKNSPSKPKPTNFIKKNMEQQQLPP